MLRDGTIRLSDKLHTADVIRKLLGWSMLVLVIGGWSVYLADTLPVLQSIGMSVAFVGFVAIAVYLVMATSEVSNNGHE